MPESSDARKVRLSSQLVLLLNDTVDQRATSPSAVQLMLSWVRPALSTSSSADLVSPRRGFFQLRCILYENNDSDGNPCFCCVRDSGDLREAQSILWDALLIDVSGNELRRRCKGDCVLQADGFGLCDMLHDGEDGSDDNDPVSDEGADADDDDNVDGNAEDDDPV